VIGTWFCSAELGVVPAARRRVHFFNKPALVCFPWEIRFKVAGPTRNDGPEGSAVQAAESEADALAKALGLLAKGISTHRWKATCVSTGVFNLMCRCEIAQRLEK